VARFQKRRSSILGELPIKGKSSSSSRGHTGPLLRRKTGAKDLLSEGEGNLPKEWALSLADRTARPSEGRTIRGEGGFPRILRREKSQKERHKDKGSPLKLPPDGIWGLSPNRIE